MEKNYAWYITREVLSVSHNTRTKCYLMKLTGGIFTGGQTEVLLHTEHSVEFTKKVELLSHFHSVEFIATGCGVGHQLEWLQAIFAQHCIYAAWIKRVHLCTGQKWVQKSLE